jgi:hypothetical protein
MFEFLKRNKEEQFWDWFVKNKSEIEIFLDSKSTDYTIYKALTKKLKNYNSILFPELTKTENNKYVLIITPDGNSEGIEPTKVLYREHPEIENWIVKKYRQPCDEIRLNFDGIEYPSSDIEIIPEFDNADKVNLNLFVRNLTKDENRYKSLAYLYLDHILGEFNTITKIGYVNFYHLDEDKRVKGGIGILTLRKLIEDKLY